MALVDNNSSKKTVVLVGVTLATVALGVVAVVTALRLRQIGPEPVVPTVPASQPQAAPEAISSCTNLFTVSTSTCGGWCDDDADCGGGVTVCDIQAGADSGVCRNPACLTEDSCECPVHLECSENFACEEVAGAGDNECSGVGNNEDCSHLECVDYACEQVAGGGDDLCENDTDCKPAEHLECRDEACVTVAGEQNNTCSSNEQCKKETHLECRDKSCVTVSGGGGNTCNNESDCREATPPPKPTSTPVPEVPQEELPEAGVAGPTMMILTAGGFFLLLGALGLLVL